MLLCNPLTIVSPALIPAEAERSGQTTADQESQNALLKWKEVWKEQHKRILRGKQGDGVNGARGLSATLTPPNPISHATASRNLSNLRASEKSLLPYVTASKPKFSALLSWQHGWHTTVPNDEWLLEPVCAYVSLFGLAISSNEDNNIAYWHGLNVLFCLSISWHKADRWPHGCTITSLAVLLYR